MPVSVPIVGHHALLRSLADDLADGHVANAYLFAGDRHLGKFTIASWFARGLLTAGLTGKAKQAADGQIDRLLHPDLLVLDMLWMEEVQEDAGVIAQSSNISQAHRQKSKAKTDTISIDDVRVLQERLQDVKEGIYRACLIRSAERFQDEAVSALLKILEEPPAGVVFLLTTQSLPSLLPTLVSRCRVLRFSRVTSKELHPLLAGIADDDRAFILRMAQGAPGIVRRLVDDPDALRMARAVSAAARTFWESHSALERLTLLKPLLDRTAEADSLLLHLALTLREELAPASARKALALGQLVQGMETNVSRQLLVQRFVLALR